MEQALVLTGTRLMDLFSTKFIQPLHDGGLMSHTIRHTNTCFRGVEFFGATDANAQVLEAALFSINQSMGDERLSSGPSSLDDTGPAQIAYLLVNIEFA